MCVLNYCVCFFNCSYCDVVVAAIHFVQDLFFLRETIKVTLIKAGVKIFATETLNINNPSPYIHYITIHLLNQTDFSDLQQKPPIYK